MLDLPSEEHGTAVALPGMRATVSSAGATLLRTLGVLQACFARARRRGVVPRLLSKRVPRRPPKLLTSPEHDASANSAVSAG